MSDRIFNPLAAVDAPPDLLAFKATRNQQRFTWSTF